MAKEKKEERKDGTKLVSPDGLPPELLTKYKNYWDAFHEAEKAGKELKKAADEKYPDKIFTFDSGTLRSKDRTRGVKAPSKKSFDDLKEKGIKLSDRP